MPKFRKDIDKLVKLARDAGWGYEQNAGKHPVLYPPDKSKPQVVVPISLSDHRGLMNFRSALRRSGLQV